MDHLHLSNRGFLSAFMRQHSSEENGDPPFCWILGSGASKTSGIPMGRILAKKWIDEMFGEEYDLPSNPTIADWANKKFESKIPGFSYEKCENFYPDIYNERFSRHPEEGFKELQKLMENARPYFGYSVLAQIMTDTKHRVAITTNFDNLIAHAITLYSKKLPFICGHELLASYVLPNLSRPLVAKIHRDLLLAPWSRPGEISFLAEQWKKPLREIFSTCTPIVIGFGDTGGSGGSLMRFLEELESVPRGIYWCYREKTPGAQPALEVQKLVHRLKGRLVPIHGFDELMTQLFDSLNLVSLHGPLKDKLNEEVAAYIANRDTVFKNVLELDGKSESETIKTTIESIKAVIARLELDSFS